MIVLFEYKRIAIFEYDTIIIIQSWNYKEYRLGCFKSDFLQRPLLLHLLWNFHILIPKHSFLVEYVATHMHFSHVWAVSELFQTYSACLYVVNVVNIIKFQEVLLYKDGGDALNLHFFVLFICIHLYIIQPVVIEMQRIQKTNITTIAMMRSFFIVPLF